MIVVFDTNVCVSALRFGGTPEDALALAIEMDQVAVSEFIESEILRVLTHKFKQDPVEVRRVIEEVFGSALRVDVRGNVTGACRDPSDNPILETAVAAQAEVLISGDKDLLSMKSFGNFAIITAAEYIRSRE